MSNELRFKFNAEKAIETILYIARRIPDPTFHSISKIFYVADKNSLERYGRFLCGDHYAAMEYGPVPSSAYNIMKNAASGENPDFKIEGGMKIKPLRGPVLSWFSESDIECLEEAIQELGHISFQQRTESTHDKAWQKAWDARDEKDSSPMPIESIVLEELEDKDLLDYLCTRHAV